MTIKGVKAESQIAMQDEAGFRQIVADHSRMLYTHIRCMVLNHDDADDVLQNTFIKAWQNLDAFRNDAGIGTWLFRIATNEALQYIRKQKVRKLFLMSAKSTSEQQSLVYVPDTNDGEAIKQKLEKALGLLSVQQRKVFGMKYFNELKYSEIAEILGLSEGAMKAVYHHAKKKIEKYLLENV